MKLSSSLSLFTTTLLVLLTQANADLQQKWNIGAVAVTNIGNDFTFLYPGTDKSFLTADDTNVQDKAQVTIYAFACKISDEDTTYGKIGIESSEFTNTSPFEMASLAYEDNESLAFKVTAVTKNMAKLPAITSPTVNDVSEMKFCVRFGLYAGDGREMNHEEMIVTLSTTLNGDFDVSTNVGAKEIEETTTTQTYKVDAILCPGQPPVFNQGALISICLSPDEQGLKDGIVLTSVDSFTWEQDIDRIPGNGNEISQSAVNEDPLVAKNTASGVLSDITVQDDQKQIIVRSILYARFFVDVGTVVAFGSCTLAFDTTRNRNRNRNRRLVRGNNSDRNNNKQRTRNLQEQENIYDGSFGVNVDVVPVNDGPVFYEAQTAGGTGLSFTTSVAVVVAATVGIAIMMLE
mmetsp:Transcript_54825/g.62190  ORF Transcript_54825/g.62190 Transcript_54825/m.62190 type:complete len:404 (+) Transcript_54825:1-1212(+)